MTVKPNYDIRSRARKNGVTIKEVAEWMHCSEMTLYRHLNCRLSPVERQRFITAIDTLAQQKNAAATSATGRR